MLRQIVVLGLLVVGAYASAGLGRCKGRLSLNTDYNKFSGKWYITGALDSPLEPTFVKCTEIKFKFNEARNDPFKIAINGTAYTKMGNARIQYNLGALLRIDGSIYIESEDEKIQAHTTIHGTDYDNFAVLSNCFEKYQMRYPYIVYAHYEFAYILTRERYDSLDAIPGDLKNQINSAVVDGQFNPSKFKSVNQTNCPADE